MINLEKKIENQIEKIKKRTSKIITIDELKAKLKKSIENKKPLRVKLGIDPTAPDIHLGFAVVLKKLREFQDLGHTAVLIIGDFTARIGDPTGKKITRPQLTDQEIKLNMKSYIKQLYKILSPNNLEIHYNSEWLNKSNFIDIIKISSQLTLQQIIDREDFSNRLKENSPIHLHELLYPLIQAYDSIMIKADIEFGGSDQEFNCLIGRILQERFKQEPQVVVLMPLLLGLDGRKMSKSYGNYIGITENPKDMFGKVMSIPDELMEQWFDLCINLSNEKIRNMLSKHPMEAKKNLAFEIVKTYYDEKKAEYSKKEFENVFQKKQYPSELNKLEISIEDMNKPLDFIFLKNGIVKSKSELKRLLNQKAIKINNKEITLEEFNKYKPKNGDIIKLGKIRFYKITIL